MSPAPKTGEHEVLPRGRSAAQVAYDYVKARLLDGRFAGGTLLSENEIAQRLDVSRTPVRQAFVQLEAEGMLELYPRRGALVVPISASEAEDVLEARQLIEQHAARRAAGAGPALARALREHIAEQEASLGGDGAGFAWSDRAFHRAIVEAGGNQLLTRQYDALRDRHQRIAAVDDRPRPVADRALRRRAPRDRRRLRGRRRRPRRGAARHAPAGRARARAALTQSAARITEREAAAGLGEVGLAERR